MIMMLRESLLHSLEKYGAVAMKRPWNDTISIFTDLKSIALKVMMLDT